MKKSKKTDKKGIYAGIGITLAFALVFAFSYGASAEFSLMDKVAQIAGTVWGNKLPVPDLEDVSFGAFPGGDIYNYLSVHAPFTQGGGCYATTTVATALTLTEDEMNTYNCFIFTSGNTNFTYTLPATSTLSSLLPEVGDMREWLFDNTASSTLTIVAGLGIDLIAVTNADDVIDGTEHARLTCMRTNAGAADGIDITCITSELVDAD